MSNNQIIIIVLVIALVAAIYFAHRNYILYKQKITPSTSDITTAEDAMRKISENLSATSTKSVTINV